MNSNENNSVLRLFETKPCLKVCAPMVRYSKLQFRQLVRLYDCDLAFTPMLLADSFILSSKARNNEFTTSKNDSPLVVQFASNNVSDFVGASVLVSPTEAVVKSK
ncbi:tRNA-dihydrouridine(20a/20b) synthase [NAD(P)+]-like isoform X3 [Atheta coriaria]|uniref:tRNA-dihydrouridine(20a/20b) synthase [NAD(P)+]-like isoform X3 n=1 Tax=Dalotia coriaria TaxID=877792 RepID=UPI0031F37C80